MPAGPAPTIQILSFLLGPLICGKELPLVLKEDEFSAKRLSIDCSRLISLTMAGMVLKTEKSKNDITWYLDLMEVMYLIVDQKEIVN